MIDSPNANPLAGRFALYHGLPGWQSGVAPPFAAILVGRSRVNGLVAKNLHLTPISLYNTYVFQTEGRTGA